MNIPRIIQYFGAMDVLNDAHMREAAVYLEHGLDPNTSLPPEAGLRGTAEIYGIRTAAIFKATGAMTLRVLGIDAIARAVTNTEFPT